MATKKNGEKKIKVPIGKPIGSVGASQQLWSVGSAAPSSGVSKSAAYSSTQAPSFFYSPELTSESWLLPKSRQEILKWARIFFNLEPYIQSIVKMHAMYPFSKFDIITPDPSVTEFYKEMAFNGEFNLYTFILQASLSYRKFGEAIPFGNLASFKGADNKTYYKWDRFILLEPELVEIKQDVWGGVPQFELIPTEDMKKSAEKILRGDNAALEALKNQISPAILSALQQGKNIPLDPEHVSLLADITDPSATRGTTQIQACFKCLTGDTRIALLNGTNPTLEELHDRNETNFWVYSTSPEGEMTPVQAERVLYVKEEETVEVTFDNGESIRCTKDHPFVLRNGEECQAQNLKPGDSMMPLYRKYASQYKKTNKNTATYEKVYDPKTNKWIFTHVVTALACKREELRGSPKKVIHHGNVHKIGDAPWNSLDNTPENLHILTWEAHASLHRKFSATPERMAELSRLGEEARNKDGKFSEQMKEHWADSEYRNKVHEAHVRRHAEMSPEMKAVIREKRVLTFNQTQEKKYQETLTKFQEGSRDFIKKVGHVPTCYELGNFLVGANGVSIYNYAQKFGYGVVGVRSPGKKVLNHKVVSVKATGRVERVYAVGNSGKYHNFAISFHDKSGVISKNTLIYQDWIRLAQTAIAQRYHFPVEIWKIGDLTHNPPIIPTEAQLTQWRNLINQSIQNPPFSIVAPPIVNYEAVSTSGKLLPIGPEYEYIQDQLMVALGVNKNIIMGEGPCIDQESRVLTREGPKYHWELSYRDEVATFNPETEALEYHKPTKIFKQLYAGQMVHFQSSKVDHVVSPGHECWTRTGMSKWKKTKAKDVIKSSRMRLHVKWEGNSLPKSITLGGQPLPPDKYLALIAYWLDHGSLRYNTKEGEYNVGLTHTKRSAELVAQLPYAGSWVMSNPSSVVTKDCYASWVIPDKQLAEDLLFTCGDGLNVGVPSVIKNLKPEHLKAFLQNLAQTLDFYITTSQKLADDLIEIALKCGMAPSMEVSSWGYKVSFGAGETFLLNQKTFKKSQAYFGVIWCVDVPNHLFISERRGKYVITGNSFSNVQTMALHRLMMEYKAIRDKFEDWMIHKFFRPIAEKNNFYYTENGRRKLMLPQISWYKSLDIQEEQAEKEMYLKLHEKGYISTRTLFSKFPNLEFETEQKHLEAEKGTVWDKEKGKRIPEVFNPSSGGIGGGPEMSLGGPPEPLEPQEPGSVEEVPIPEEVEPVTETPAAEVPGAPALPTPPVGI